MAEPFLEEIYEYAAVASELRHIVEYIRIRDDHHAVYGLNEIIERLCAACRSCVESGYEEGPALWQQVKGLTVIQGDLVLLGDILENEVIPMLERWIRSFGHISVEADEDNLLESSENGFLTLKKVRAGLYLHSKNDPMEEARKFVENYYEPRHETYSVFGCGLGYHVLQLYRVSRGSVKITVYETDPRVAEYARRYGVLDWIPEEKLQVVTEDSVLAFLNSIDDGKSGMLFHVPSVRQISNEVEREALLSVLANQNTIHTFLKDTQINFWRNRQAELKDVSQIEKSSLPKEMVVVAAGPSLDDDLVHLRSWQGQKTIIAVGTVFRKLLKEGIRPDFVAVMDPQARTLKQIEGVEEENIPLVLDITAYWEFARRYKGPKYTVCKNGGGSEVAMYARERGLEQWNTGGTVTSLALQLAIHLDAETIYLSGVDLSYPTGVSHAKETMDFGVKNTENLCLAEGVCGRKVHTSLVFLSYKRDIEEIIARTPGIEYINLSTIGLHIQGAAEGVNMNAIERKEDLQENTEKKIFRLSAIYESDKQDAVLFQIADYISTADMDCLRLENIRKQLNRIFFVKSGLTLSYAQERKIHENLIQRWKEQHCSFGNYLPYEKRNKGVILITTDQFLSLRHAPTKLICLIASCLQNLGFQVYLLVNVVDLPDREVRRLWHNPIHFNVLEKLYGRGMLNYEGIEIPYLQVNYTRNTNAAVAEVSAYLDEVKPELVWHIGGNCFLADVIGECSSLIATRCSTGYPVSQADVLASYMNNDDSYSKESLSYIQKVKQKNISFLSPLVNVDKKTASCERKQYDLPEDKFLAVIVGNRLNLEIDKAFTEWVEEILRHEDDIVFVTIGGKKLEWSDTKYGDKIIQLGYQENLSSILSCMDIFVNPPRKGGGGGALAALEAGLPVLTLSDCDVAAAVEGSFICNDLQEMRDVLIRCYRDRGYYTKMCEEAKQLYDKHLQKYSEKEVQKSVANVIAQTREWVQSGEIK